jgi:predicted extracellular nuclease
MVRTAILVALLAGLPAPTSADEYIKLGSWNIENLGDRTLGQFPAALAEHVLLSGVDVLALQEIWDNDGDDSRITNSKLDDVFRRVNANLDHDWTYLLVPQRNPLEARQHLGVAWNRKKLTLAGEPYRIDVAYANAETWKRTPYAVKFSVREGQSDFVLIPLHMKSNLPAEGLPEPVVLRTQEAEALIDRLADVRTHFGDHDVILLGDTNCLNGDEPALQAYFEAGFLDLNRSDAVTYHKGQYRNPFDRILVPREQAEFRYTFQYVLTPAKPGAHLDRYSDHYLVLAAMRVLEDDD